ncbi:MAG: IS6 family transposase, partial [Nitrosopumilaceae archaeon]
MEKTNPRQQRGEEIANKQNQITRIDGFTYKVNSQTTNKIYDVIKTELGWICSCPDHNFRKICCKHIHACEFSLKIREQVKNEITIEPIEISSCPRCTSNDIVKHGIRYNKSGNIQRYSCLDCSKWFSFNIGFEKMKSNPQAITSALQLYFTGESLRNVQKFLRLQGVEVSHQTIYNWINKYTNLMEKYLEKITPHVSDKWRADEVFTKVKGNPRYLFALMDDETRFWIAKEMSDKKHGFDARGLFAKGREVTGKKPKVLVTDGLHSFGVAFRKEYWTIKSPRSVHVKNITLKGEKNNNTMDRLN